MAGKHPNVFVGTAAYPPHHWPPELVRFIAGAGRGKVLLGIGRHGTTGGIQFSVHA